MRIERVDTFPICLPEGDSFGGHGTSRSQAPTYSVQPGWKGIYASRIETLLVRVVTDSGLVGWGEGQSPIAPEVAATIVERILAPVVVGRNPMATEILWREMYELMSVRGHTGGFMLDAISAVDIALWDIRGKALGVPVAELLGGPGRESIPCYVSGIRGGSDTERAAEMRRFLDRGFDKFKYFGGFGVDRDLATMQTLRDEGGPQAGLAFDALWRYSREEALYLGRALHGLGCLWFEAPVDTQDIEGHAELARRLDLPIAGGETSRTRRELVPWLEARAFDLLQPDIGRCGITEGVRIIDFADLRNMVVTLHCGIASPVMVAASLHVAAARPAVSLMEYQPVVLAAANRLLTEPIRCEGGAFNLPVSAGLGIEIDEAALGRLARSEI